MISAGDIPQAPPEQAQLPSELARLVAESIAEKQREERGSAPPSKGPLAAVHAEQALGGPAEREGGDCQARRPRSPTTESSAGNSRHAAASDSLIASSVHE